MKEITISRFHGILYRFFAILVCFGGLMIAMDVMLLTNHHNLFLFGHEMKGWDNLLAFTPELGLIIFGWFMAQKQKKLSEATKWR